MSASSDSANRLHHLSSTQAQTDPKTANKPYDIVLFGATSFVGQLTARYLQQFLDPTYHQTHKDNNQHTSIRWAIAGRNASKLAQLKVDLDALDVPALIADSTDQASLDAMCQQTNVIISTVGPYLEHGEKLIQACVQNGTDYVDLTGEVLFIKDMMNKYSADAKSSGARIVNSCGFDSVPSDLGVLFTQNTAQEKLGEPCSTIHMRVKDSQGGVSGGTAASMATVFAEASKSQRRRDQLANPYLLNDDDDAPSTKQDSVRRPRFDQEHDRWLAPFIMESINTRIVHRSNQLMDYAYGRQFKYDEAMWMPAGIKGQAMSYAIAAGMAGFAAGMSFDVTRNLLQDHVLPQSGSGPSKQQQDSGYFDLRFFGKTASGDEICIKVTGDKDPGYGSTCQMLAQSALCLLQDTNKEDKTGGFWTPAAAMGEALIKRLQKHAGIKFEVVS